MFYDGVAIVVLGAIWLEDAAWARHCDIDAPRDVYGVSSPTGAGAASGKASFQRRLQEAALDCNYLSEASNWACSAEVA